MKLQFLLLFIALNETFLWKSARNESPTAVNRADYSSQLCTLQWPRKKSILNGIFPSFFFSTGSFDSVHFLYVYILCLAMLNDSMCAYISYIWICVVCVYVYRYSIHMHVSLFIPGSRCRRCRFLLYCLLLNTPDTHVWIMHIENWVEHFINLFSSLQHPCDLRWIKFRTHNG